MERRCEQRGGEERIGQERGGKERGRKAEEDERRKDGRAKERRGEEKERWEGSCLIFIAYRLATPTDAPAPAQRHARPCLSAQGCLALRLRMVAMKAL